MRQSTTCIICHTQQQKTTLVPYNALVPCITVPTIVGTQPRSQFFEQLYKTIPQHAIFFQHALLDHNPWKCNSKRDIYITITKLVLCPCGWSVLCRALVTHTLDGLCVLIKVLNLPWRSVLRDKKTLYVHLYMHAFRRTKLFWDARRFKFCAYMNDW